MFKKDIQESAPVDLNDLIAEALALTHGEAQKQQVQVRVELAQRLPEVLGNRIQLQQVMLNLILNAIEAMIPVTDRARTLRLKSEVNESNTVLLTVEDSGTGIDPKNAERIFDALFTTKSHGTGMGLAICRSIIETHHGRLWASPGARYGSVFQLVLPSGKPGLAL
jgi:signal transduction histidine kinase